MGPSIMIEPLTSSGCTTMHHRYFKKSNLDLALKRGNDIGKTQELIVVITNCYNMWKKQNEKIVMDLESP